MNEEIHELMEECLNCITKPCSQKGCPLENDIPTFIKLAKEEKLEEAYFTLLKTSILGSICGRICPHTKQCMGSCIKGIKGKSVNIGEIEKYISDYGLKNNLINKIEKNNILNGRKVAVIGSGPAGLTCSYFLAKEGAEVIIYEKYKNLGGILAHGIPEFRLKRDVITKTIEAILSLGIKVEYEKELGKNLFIKNLAKEYDAIFLGIGANIASKMNIIGEDLDGVYSGNELLEKNNHPSYIGKSVAVIGGGNVAIDTARTVKRLGAKNVYVIYRRSREEMPAEDKEVEEAIKEGIEFLFQNNIVSILGKNKVEKIECIRTELIKKEEENRLSPININGSNYYMNIDYIIMAIGSKPEENIIKDFNKNKRGYVLVDENMRTSIKKVYAGGDIIGERATVAWAAKSGRTAAYNIIKGLCK